MRSDRTHACLRCRARTPAGLPRCPRCAHERLVDLASEAGHAALEASERRRARGRRLLAGSGVAALGAVALGVGARLGPAELLGFASAALLLAAAVTGVRSGPLEPVDPSADPSDDPSTCAITGRALSIVGVRVVGASHRGPIDDALVLPFAIETPDGRRVEIDPTHAVLALEVEPAHALPVGTAFIWARGGAPVGPWRAARVEAGAWLRVAGRLEAGPDAERFVGSAAAPLRIEVARGASASYGEGRTPPSEMRS